MAKEQEKEQEVVQEATETKAKTAPKKSKGPEKISVEKGILEQIKEKMDAQDEVIKKQTAELERLKYAADKGRLYRFDQRREEDIIRTARVGLWRDDNGVQQIVSGWVTEKDDVYFDNQGKMHINQKVKLLLGEGDSASEVVVDHLYWFQNMESIVGDIVGETVDKTTGVHSRNIKFSDGREVVMDIRFINP